MSDSIHFFEGLERKIDFQKEYIKLEMMCSKKYGETIYSNGVSIYSWIEQYFLCWEKRLNYTSFEEVREQLKLAYVNEKGEFCEPYFSVGVREYILFSEMLINIITGLEEYNNYLLDEIILAVLNTIKATVEIAGMEIKKIDDSFLILEKNAISIEVADKNPELADVIIEYNHYLLKGNLDRKVELLRHMADALEPKKKELKKICAQNEDDYFYLVNNMNVRHNNCDPSDSSKYNPKFACLKAEEKEEWYDLIYEQGLFLFMMLEQQERRKIIKDFKC